MIFLKINILLKVAIVLAHHGLQIESRGILRKRDDPGHNSHRSHTISGSPKPVGEGNDADSAAGSEQPEASHGAHPFLQHDQYRALDYPDMDDSPPRVVLSIKKHRSLTASALPAPFLALGQQDISTTTSHGRQLQTTWSQRGGNIYGEAQYNHLGESISISADGWVLAVGLAYNDGNGLNSGSVRVYDWDGSNHVQRGDDIDGEAEWDQFGESISISADGLVLAVGASWNNGNGNKSGSVRVYDWDGSTHLQRGDDIDGEAKRDFSGKSVSISGDGFVLAVGATYNDGNGVNSGSVRVYDWDGSNHVQRGDDIDGEAKWDQFGHAISISDDGSVLAVGAPWNNGNGVNSGSVRVYDWDGSNYVKRGDDIDGEGKRDIFGWSVAISDDGSVLAVGAKYNGGNGKKSGSVSVYDWDGTNHVQRGNYIYGEANNDMFGWSVAISGDGSVLAAGAPNNSGYSGSVRVYDWDGFNHVQRGDDIDGEAASDQFGYSVAISGDGSVLAIGAPYNDGNGVNIGSAQVYTLAS